MNDVLVFIAMAFVLFVCYLGLWLSKPKKVCSSCAGSGEWVSQVFLGTGYKNIPCPDCQNKKYVEYVTQKFLEKLENGEIKFSTEIEDPLACVKCGTAPYSHHFKGCELQGIHNPFS